MANQISPIELQKHLGGVDYPATKDQLVDHARKKGAGDDLIQVLDQIPDREYDGPSAVSAEFSKQA